MTATPEFILKTRISLQKLQRKGKADGETMGQIVEQKKLVEGSVHTQYSLSSCFLNTIIRKYNIAISRANSFFSQEYIRLLKEIRNSSLSKYVSMNV